MDKIEKRLQDIIDRFEQIESELCNENLTQEDLVKLSKERSDMVDLTQAISKKFEFQKQIPDLKVIIDENSDEELVTMAREELYEINGQLIQIDEQIKILLLPKSEEDRKNAMVEIRAGAGGEEAALFAGVLFKIYQKYAENQGWKTELMSISESNLDGFKEVVFSVIGKDVFSKLKYESGVHRVQRVPETESSGRIHTSTVTVAVLPEVDEIDIKIDEKELRIDVFRASGAGGQHVNTTESAVRITHIYV
jgi:peptide chain release factor 1